MTPLLIAALSDIPHRDGESDYRPGTSGPITALIRTKNADLRVTEILLLAILRLPAQTNASATAIPNCPGTTDATLQ